MFLLLTIYSKDGIIYEDETMKTLQKITLSSIKPKFVVKESVENIEAGSVIDSPFYFCRSNIGEISFETNSKLKKISNFLLSETSVTKIDMSNCGSVNIIGEKALYNCPNLVEIILPPNVATIQVQAISKTSISSISLPDSVITLETYCLCNNPNLANVEITHESKLVSLYPHVFMNTIITSFYFPKGLVDVRDAPFLFSRITKFEIDPLNPKFSLDSKCITVFTNEGKNISIVANMVSGEYKSDPNVIDIGPQTFRGSLFTSFVLSEKTVSIGSYAFAETGIKSLKLPNSLTDIKAYAFANCKIETITLPESVTVITENAFRTAVHLNSIKLPSTLTEIQSFAFCQCTSLLYIEIPPSVTKFGNSVFAQCNKNIEVNFMNNTKLSIVRGMVFVDGSKLVEYFGAQENADILIPNFCEEIPDMVFSSKSIKSVKFETGIGRITFGQNAFAYSSLQTIQLPEGLERVDNSCFIGCTNLKEISFTSTNVAVINESCFNGCKRLSKVCFKNSRIKSILNDAFNGTAITQIDFENSAIEKIHSGAFRYTPIVNITLPSTVSLIENFAFDSCTSLKEASLAQCSLLTIVSKYSFSYCSSMTSITLGSNVETLDENCFRECTSLRFLKLAPKTKTLMINCLYKCTSLEAIQIPAESCLSRIYPYALDGCTNLKRFDIETEDKFLFENGALTSANRSTLIFYLPTTKKSSIIISGNIKEIYDYAFQSCNNLREVIVSDGALAKIGFQAFKDCKNLQRLVLPRSLTEIGKEAFSGCGNLKCGCVYVPEEIRTNVIEVGKMQSSVFNSVCVEKGCEIFFDQVTCLHRNPSINKLTIAIIFTLFL